MARRLRHLHLPVLIRNGASFRDGLDSGGVVVLASGGARTLGQVVTFRQPGAYRFVCSQPGHEAAGLSGAITAR